ncbi:lia operon protein LiaG [Clostridium cavendishii DSM 21758]|uniref:Lia operon protein LiaG n=1 Tax=Clostridium cavendishii DSM 21758 TaxID=1121302 RepID=A0A1M6M0J6_9CLOT|nr:DUF4097 family beta strand repeat-containing protein [Clostridium cavendishii]SHJ76978.1 lia operon protein LiaG [Clostridium cavendishii DSM 21758]
MNKNLKIINITIWVIVIIFLIGILIYGVSNGVGRGGNFFSINLRNGATSVQKEEIIQLDKCDNINLDFSSDDIIISLTDDDNVKVVQKSGNKLSEDEKFTFSKDENTINIKSGNFKKVFNIFFFGSFDNKIELSIPKKYNKSLDIKTNSGNIEVMDNLNLDKFISYQSSGDFKCRKTITANDVNLKTSSGSIRPEDLVTKSYNLRTSSGDIVVGTLSGSGELEASSGSIKIDYKEMGDRLKAHTSSGDIKVNIPKGISFNFYAECSSGDISTDFDVSYSSKKKNRATAKLGNGPYKEINLSANSGDIKVYQK